MAMKQTGGEVQQGCRRMSTRGASLLLFVLATVVAIPVRSAAEPAGGDDVTILRAFDAGAGQHPESVAVDKRGQIYVSMPFTGVVLRIDPDGSEQVAATLPIGGGFGPLGLAVDAPGNIYAAVATFDPATHGVYRVRRSGSFIRLPGTEAIAFPNGLAYDNRGTLYVTDSMAGAVWRIPKRGEAELWAQHVLLEGDGTAPLPFPLGANGIAYRQRTLYVSNTERGSIVRLPINADGSAGAASLLVQRSLLGGADAVAFDVRGNLYVAVTGQSTLVRVSPGGDLSTLATRRDGLDYASGVAFGTGRRPRTTLFLVNFAIGRFFGDETPGTGPALLSLDVGIPGLPHP